MNAELASIQNLVIDLSTVQRNHRLPQADRQETVVEHCFSVSLLCWFLFERLGNTGLDKTRVFQYCLAHDALERHLDEDISTYASAEERAKKNALEAVALEQLKADFSHFGSLVQVVQDYEEQIDDEATFVKTVDKIQAVLLGWQDDWWPYRKRSVSYQDFYDKGETVETLAPDCLKQFVREFNTQSRAAYFQQP